MGRNAIYGIEVCLRELDDSFRLGSKWLWFIGRQIPLLMSITLTLYIPQLGKPHEVVHMLYRVNYDTILIVSDMEPHHM